MLSAEPDPAPIGEKRQPFIVSKAALSMVTAFGMLPRATACQIDVASGHHNSGILASVQRRGGAADIEATSRRLVVVPSTIERRS